MKVTRQMPHDRVNDHEEPLRIAQGMFMHPTAYSATACCRVRPPQRLSGCTA